MDITSYLKLYKKNPFEMAEMIIKDIYDTTGICATAGIGTNLYLTKVALDIVAKHVPNHIGYLDEEKYKKELWHHEPLTDFWRIGNGTVNRLHKLHLKDMYDICCCDEKILYKEFGINAEFLIDHAWGRESCLIEDIKRYKPQSNSFSNSQILFRDYRYDEARIVLLEMIDTMVLQLVKEEKYTGGIGFFIGYSKDVCPVSKFSTKLDNKTNDIHKIANRLLDEYDYLVNRDVLIRRLGICFFDVGDRNVLQLNLFSEEDDKNENIYKAINKIKDKFGKNAILLGASYQEGATQKIRNTLIGGHNGGEG